MKKIVDRFEDTRIKEIYRNDAVWDSMVSDLHMLESVYKRDHKDIVTKFMIRDLKIKMREYKSQHINNKVNVLRLKMKGLLLWMSLKSMLKSVRLARLSLLK